VPHPIPPCQTQIADLQGNVEFRFDPPAAGETFRGTINVPNAPGGASFQAFLGSPLATPVGAWIASNPFGPVQARQGVALYVVGMSLQPGTVYECIWQGIVTVNDTDEVPTIPSTTVVQPPNAIFLGTTEVNPAGTAVEHIALDTSWRAIWAIVGYSPDDTSVPALIGDQSILSYEPFTPGYFGDAKFYRWPMLAGVDTTLTLSYTNLSGSDTRIWWGADLDTIDVVAYGPSGGGGEVNYALEAGGNLAAILTALGNTGDIFLEIEYGASAINTQGAPFVTHLVQIGGQNYVATGGDGKSYMLNVDANGQLRVAVTFTVPSNSTAAAYVNAQTVKASAGTLYGVTGYNSGPGQFIQLFDAATATGLPVVVLWVPAASSFSLDYGDRGRAFATGITIANSSTGPTYTAGAADCWFDAQYA